MKQLANVRKADKAHGDDLSLTRWVKEPGRHTKPSRTGLAPADASSTRLHALGDFFSHAYVEWWAEQLEQHPNLSIFGYTARDPLSIIGIRLQQTKIRFGRRFAVRWSNGWLPADNTVSIKTEADCPPNAFMCPEQTGKTICCATCGACWSTTKNVAFLEH